MPRPLAALLAVVAAAAILLLPAPDASAAPVPTVSPSTVQRGQATLLSGAGCVSPTVPADPWNTPMVVASAGAFTGAVQASADGGWSLSVDVGGHLGPGKYTISARCSYRGSGGFDYPPVTLTVVGEPLPPEWWEPGGSGPPGQPTGPSAAPPAPPTPSVPAVAGTTAPRPTSPAPSGAAPAPAPVATPVTAPTGAPSADCVDCALLADGGPLEAGHELRLRYTGFQAGEQVTVVMRSTPTTLGTYTADATGTVTATVTLPEDTEAGEHTLTFSGAASGDLVVVPISVAAAEPAGTTAARRAPVPSDGRAAVLWLGVSGLAVAVLGAGALLLLRRRDSAAPHELTGRAPQATATPIAEPIT